MILKTEQTELPRCSYLIFFLFFSFLLLLLLLLFYLAVIPFADVLLSPATQQTAGTGHMQSTRRRLFAFCSCVGICVSVCAPDWDRSSICWSFSVYARWFQCRRRRRRSPSISIQFCTNLWKFIWD